MLQLIIGTAGTGKSLLIKEKILANARNGKKSILIVPEQFSKTGETEIFSALEKNQFGFVSVFSFTSLLRDVQSEQGIVPSEIITDAGKAVIAQKSFGRVKNHLESYGKLHNSINFSYELSRLFEDFRRNGVDSAQLFELARNAPQANGKLRDIAAIYTGYCADMAQSGSDMEQLYTDLSETLPESYTDSTEIFIDGFESFSHGQFAILTRMMKKAENVYVTLTADRIFDNTEGTHPLSYTADTAQQLVACAKKAGVAVAREIKMEQQHRFLNKTLCNVDNYILSRPLCDADCSDGAFVNTFATQFEEVCFAVAQIRSLVKQGYKYDDIAVVCPQLEKYEHQLQESFSLAEIPFFIDQNRIILSSAPVVLIREVLEIMDKGVSADTVLPLLKTNLTVFDSESINWLENYTYIWQDQDLDWSKPFTLPYGRISDGEVEEGDSEILSRINTLAKGVKNVFESYEKCGGEDTGENILSEMYRIVGDLKSEDILTNIINHTPDKDKADLFIRQWETAVDCINELYSICGKMVMRPREIAELFMLMVQGSEIGFAPQTQDCVIISTPQRMKVDTVKVVFVLGAGQDVFPSLVSDSGILSAADVQYLKDNDMAISGDFARRFAFENLYFYKTMTTARELLFVSCAERNLDSQEVMSAEIEGIKAALGLGESRLSVEDYCITEEFFLHYISETKGAEGISALQKLGIEIPSVKKRVFSIENLDKLRQLVGEHMVISPTAAENYYKCAFGYLMGNLFKIYPLEKAQLTQREAGDYLHTVAQKVLEKYNADYFCTDWAEIETEARVVVGEYLQNNYPKQVRDTARFAALSEDMLQNALQLLRYIHEEQKNSAFRPVAFEKQIGFDSDIKPLTVTLDDGSRVSIIGVCDRIDAMEAEGRKYIRIVDYKTGTKKFSLEDVYNGISSQLLLYMNSVLESESFAENSAPAAVVYQPSDAAFRFDDDGALYTPVGMAVKSKLVSEGFDREAEGRFGVIAGEEKIKGLAGSEVVDEKTFAAVLDYTKEKIKNMAQQVYAGKFDNLPMDLGGEKTACEWCGYRAVCLEYDRIKPREKADFRVKEDDNG